MKAIPPPSAGDVLRAVSAYAWPAVTVDGRVIASEAAWRATLESASPSARWRLWNALRDADEAGREARTTASIRTVSSDGYAPATPTKDERDLVQRLAHLAVTEGGLRLRPFRLEWYSERGQLWSLPAGITYHTERPVRVGLLLPRDRRDLARTFFHECQHVADAIYHLDDMDVDTRERRAEAFAERMMRRWRG